ncbi:phosphatidate cytidylyltransferase [Jannaschia rubra]|uniref:Phosphatidate cytidylyltransferase n=1 Tax=Jannaschia rubra TaxID=282197 RepID=A0A0M6XMG1_9RHOB|nr:phosphatidate cytidylyltransferase [Jannaschia rubra]CTQ31401.1 Phosphatidate cytidylyltransferase [Jannaschia rubra]SFF80266.1 phosphatidate cytidylyltransferase [Jannaschia rubra]
MIPDLIVLLAWIGGLLVVATLIGHVLQRRLSPDGRNEGVENLVARIRAWWVMAILIALAFLAGRTGVVILFALCSFAALREFVTLTNARRADHWTLAIAFFVVIPLQYWLVWAGEYGIYSIFIPVYAFLLGPIVSALRCETTNFLVRVAEIQWALMIAVFCASHVPALLTLDIPGHEGRGVLLIAFLIVVVQMSDVLQYVWGKLIGRRRIAPRLSPSKTVEGFAGGVLSATAIGAMLYWITPFTPLQAAVMAFVIAIMGFFGGLVMSAIKRDRGVKDWGHTIEGHGGFIDRLDSVVFSAPIFFHLTRYWWT